MTLSFPSIPEKENPITLQRKRKLGQKYTFNKKRIKNKIENIQRKRCKANKTQNKMKNNIMQILLEV